MAEGHVDALLERMEKISEAVNAFASESVQQAAFAALISAFEAGATHRKAVPTIEVEHPTPSEAIDDAEGSSSGNGSAVRRRRSKSNGGSKAPSVAPVRDLNLRPSGVQSFDEFVAEKLPRDNQERYIAAVYYLEQIADVKPITLGHIAAVFKQTNGWREPENLAAG